MRHRYPTGYTKRVLDTPTARPYETGQIFRVLSLGEAAVRT
jgi:hypothetical protein